VRHLPDFVILTGGIQSQEKEIVIKMNERKLRVASYVEVSKNLEKAGKLVGQ